MFINPVTRGTKHPESPWKANNRSFEYDTLSDQYSKLLLDEILPEVGKTVKLSDRPRTARSAGFPRVAFARSPSPGNGRTRFTRSSARGKFHQHPRRTRLRSPYSQDPNKNIRVFLQDGSKDLDNEHGNWWLGNLQMEASLKFKKYDHKFVGGEGGHNGIHGGAILPDSLRWLWRTEAPVAP